LKDPPPFFIFLVPPSVSIFSNTTLQQKYKTQKKTVVSWGQDDQFRHLRLVKFLWIC